MFEWERKRKNSLVMKHLFLFSAVIFFLVANSSLFPAHINTGTMNKTVGVRFQGNSAVAGQVGFSVGCAGDVDGDKVKDFLIGVPTANSLQSGVSAGQVYVLYGQQNTTAAMGIWGSDFNLFTLISSPLLGRVIDGVVSGSQAGSGVSTAGDFNADGLSDVLIGAAFWNSHQGKAFVVFGKSKESSNHTLVPEQPEFQHCN